jgi:hypothetical protein
MIRAGDQLAVAEDKQESLKIGICILFSAEE